jgi:hypothetical protein
MSASAVSDAVGRTRSRVSYLIFAWNVFRSGVFDDGCVPPKYVCGSGEPLLLPVGDLGGMDAELLSQLSQRLVPFDGGQCHLGLVAP